MTALISTLVAGIYLTHSIGFQPGLGHVISCYNMALRLSQLLQLTMLHTPLHVGHDLGMTPETFMDLGYDMMNETDHQFDGAIRDKLPCELHLARQMVDRYRTLIIPSTRSSTIPPVILEWSCGCGFDVDYRDTIGWWRRKWRRAVRMQKRTSHPSATHGNIGSLDDEVRVAIHIRRGDYIDLRDDRLLPDTYYATALEHILRALSRVLPATPMSPLAPCDGNIIANMEHPSLQHPSHSIGSKPLPYTIRVQIISEVGQLGVAVDHKGVESPWPSRINDMAVKLGLEGRVICDLLLSTPAVDSLISLSDAHVMVGSRSIYSLLAALFAAATAGVRVMPHMWQSRSTNDVYHATNHVIITDHHGHMDDTMIEQWIHTVLINR